jgi:hypothetical protein
MPAILFDTFEKTVLSPGAYSDTISIFEDGVLTDTLPGSFNVAPESSAAGILSE